MKDMDFQSSHLFSVNFQQRLSTELSCLPLIPETPTMLASAPKHSLHRIQQYISQHSPPADRTVSLSIGDNQSQDCAKKAQDMRK